METIRQKLDKNRDLAKIFLLLANLWDFPSENVSQKTKAFLIALGKDLGVSIPQDFFFKKEELQEEYTRLFINNPEGVPAPPYASVYEKRGLLNQRPAQEALLYYTKAGVFPNSSEPADHIVSELAFVSFLLERGDLVLLSGFLAHLLQWFPFFHKALQKAEPHIFFAFLAQLTESLLFKLKEEVSK